LRARALALEPGGLRTKLLLPPDQVRILQIDDPGADEAAILRALEGATPYAVADLAWDASRGGGRTHVAAVARETLAEAEAFAAQHGFAPVSVAAVPPPLTLQGEAFFGETAGAAAGPERVERDEAPTVAAPARALATAPGEASEAAPAEATGTAEAEPTAEPEAESPAEPATTDAAETGGAGHGPAPLPPEALTPDATTLDTATLEAPSPEATPEASPFEDAPAADPSPSTPRIEHGDAPAAEPVAAAVSDALPPPARPAAAPDEAPAAGPSDATPADLDAIRTDVAAPVAQAARAPIDRRRSGRSRPTGWTLPERGTGRPATAVPQVRGLRRVRRRALRPRPHLSPKRPPLRARCRTCRRAPCLSGPRRLTSQMTLLRPPRLSSRPPVPPSPSRPPPARSARRRTRSQPRRPLRRLRPPRPPRPPWPKPRRASPP
jgi:hypothetical protein